MTEIAIREAALPTPTEWEMATQMADALIRTAFVPKGLKDGGPGAVLACIFAGKELGLGPMTAIREIDVIQGNPSPSGQLLAALARRHGHKIEFLEYTNVAVTVKGTRCDDGTSLEVRWTMDDAVKAGLADKQVWKQYPRSMLLWRCLTELNRALFSGESLGIGKYSGEEMGRDELPAGNVKISGIVFNPADSTVVVENKKVDVATGEIIEAASEVVVEAEVYGGELPAPDETDPIPYQPETDPYVSPDPEADQIPFDSTAPPPVEESEFLPHPSETDEVVYEPAQMARAALIRRTLGVLVSHGVDATEDKLFIWIKKKAKDGRSVFYGFEGEEFEDLSERQAAKVMERLEETAKQHREGQA